MIIVGIILRVQRTRLVCGLGARLEHSLGGLGGGTVGSVEPGGGTLVGGSIGVAVGSFLGSLLDGDSPGDGLLNGAIDGGKALFTGAIIGKIIQIGAPIIG